MKLRTIVGIATSILAIAGCGSPTSTLGSSNPASTGVASGSDVSLSYEDLGGCTVAIGPNPEYFKVAAPRALAFYNYLTNKGGDYDHYLKEQLALSQLEDNFATGYQELLQPGAVERMSRDLCAYNANPDSADRALLEALDYYYLPPSALTVAAAGSEYAVGRAVLFATLLCVQAEIINVPMDYNQESPVVDALCATRG